MLPVDATFGADECYPMLGTYSLIEDNCSYFAIVGASVVHMRRDLALSLIFVGLPE